MRRVALLALPAMLVGAFTSSPSLAREYDALRPWYVEGSLGLVRPGPSSDFGSGQNYAAHAGFQWNRWSDVGLSAAWAHARSSSSAIETDVVSGGVRARGWTGVGRWSPFAEISARLHHFSLVQRSVLSPTSEKSLRAGGHLGVGVIYARSTWWAGLGAELHTSFGPPLFDEGNTVSFTTYNLFVGRR
jgi:hypothetical protein